MHAETSRGYTPLVFVIVLGGSDVHAETSRGYTPLVFVIVLGGI